MQAHTQRPTFCEIFIKKNKSSYNKPNASLILCVHAQCTRSFLNNRPYYLSKTINLMLHLVAEIIAQSNRA